MFVPEWKCDLTCLGSDLHIEMLLNVLVFITDPVYDWNWLLFDLH